MPVMLPSAELLSQWAAEELWDWRVRALFGVVCALAAIAVLIIYLVWGRKQTGLSDGKARRYMGRISITLFVVALAEASFFKEPVSTMLLIATALAIGAIALGMPQEGTNLADLEAQPDQQEA